MINQGSRSLNSAIRKLTNLLTVKLIPLLVIKLQIELGNKLGIDEVDKGVPHIARVVRINRQVEKVVFQLVVLVYLVDKHLLRVLVWNVSDH